MALTDLKLFNRTEYDKLSKTPIDPPARKSREDKPRQDVVISLGGCTPLGELAFIMQAPPGTRLEISTKADTLDVLSLPPNTSEVLQDTYWTVNQGVQVCGGTNEWRIKFDTDPQPSGRTDPGKWVFTKGVGVDV